MAEGTRPKQLTPEAAELLTVTYVTEFDNGSSGAADTIDWTVGQKQRTTLTAATVTLTFTAPPGVGNFVLKVIQDGAGGRFITWPASVKWPSATPPVLTVAAGSIDIVSFYYDGTNYFGVASYAFA